MKQESSPPGGAVGTFKKVLKCRFSHTQVSPEPDRRQTKESPKQMNSLC